MKTEYKLGWHPAEWQRLDVEVRTQALAQQHEKNVQAILTRFTRRILKHFSTSFFLVTRFLPFEKRCDVEAVYAAVRYPDEVVDSFPWSDNDKYKELERCWVSFEKGLGLPTVQDRLVSGIPSFLIPFIGVVNKYGIPPQYYADFLEAMRKDIRPEPYESLASLIDSYVYGSAIVIGYFLTYIYGTKTRELFPKALESARELGIALQMTNFLRDIREDFLRNRLYIPLDILHEVGLTNPDPFDPQQEEKFKIIIKDLAQMADTCYQKAEDSLDCFPADCLPAIHSCLKVYRQLNYQIATSPNGLNHREKVSFFKKFRILPVSKYWRLPVAFLTS